MDHPAEAEIPPESGLGLRPATEDWFRNAYGSFTEAQRLCIPALLAGQSALLLAPTGSGKTLAGFLGILDGLAREADAAGGRLGSGVRAIYLSPLRALTYDIAKNLRLPLAGMGLENIVRLGVRTGDTPQAERARLRREPPHLLLTTPESLAVLLCLESFRKNLATCRHVICDEIHSLAGSKRGAHLAVSLERLEKIVCSASGDLCRVGLSATVGGSDAVAGFLTGGRPCRIIEARTERRLEVEVFSPLRRDPYPVAGHSAGRVMEELARIVRLRRSVIIFTNTRSGAEITGLRLRNILTDLAGSIEVHHSSLDRSVRLEVEDRLKRGELRCVVCSTSLEMGVDIGAVELVVMIAAPKGVARALQRIGRSGHSVHEISRGLLVASNVSDLVECLVTASLVRDRRLEQTKIYPGTADVLAQHLMGLAMQGGFTPADAYALVRNAWPFRNLEQAEFNRTLEYLQGGGRALEGQYSDVFGRVRIGEDGTLETSGKKTERDYLINIGVIVDEADVSVRLRGRRLGGVEEYFVKRLNVGDTFVFAGRVVRLVKSGATEIEVTEAAGQRPSVPVWGQQKMSLSTGLASGVAEFRTEMARRIEGGETREATLDWLVETWETTLANAEAVLRHFEAQAKFSLIPTRNRLVLEIYHEPETEEDGEMLVQCFFHSLVGRAANDALSRIVALRVKRQAGGNALVTVDDYGFLLTLHQFQVLDEPGWRACLAPENAQADLSEALRDSELVKWQFRGIAQTGLMAPRRNLADTSEGAGRRGLRRARWNSEILFQVLRNHEPDHPLLAQAYTEAMNIYLDTPAALAFMSASAGLDWQVRQLPAVAPFSFGMYLSKMREAMTMENPEEAVERLYRQMAEKMHSANGNSTPLSPPPGANAAPAEPSRSETAARPRA